jgi:hypothetical protein
MFCSLDASIRTVFFLFIHSCVCFYGQARSDTANPYHIQTPAASWLCTRRLQAFALERLSTNESLRKSASCNRWENTCLRQRLVSVNSAAKADLQNQLQAIQRELALHARIMRINVGKTPSLLQPVASSSMMPSITTASLPPPKPRMFEGVVPLSVSSRAAAAAAAAVTAAALDAAQAGFEHCRKAPLPLPDEKRHIHLRRGASTPPPPQLASLGADAGNPISLAPPDPGLAPVATVSKMRDHWEELARRSSANPIATPARNSTENTCNGPEDGWTLVSVTCDETTEQLTAGSPSNSALDSPMPLGVSQPLDRPAADAAEPLVRPPEIQPASPRRNGVHVHSPPPSRIPRLSEHTRCHHTPPPHVDESEASTLGLSDIPCLSKLPPPPPKRNLSPSVKPYAEAPPPQAIFIQIPRSWVCPPSSPGAPPRAPLSPTASPRPTHAEGLLDPKVRPLLAEAAARALTAGPAQNLPASAEAGRGRHPHTQLSTIAQSTDGPSEDAGSDLGVFQALQERAPSGMGNEAAALPKRARGGRDRSRKRGSGGGGLEDVNAKAVWLSRTLQPLLCMRGRGKLMTDSQRLLMSSGSVPLAIE